MQTFHVKRLPEKVGIMAGEPEEDLKEFQLFELFTKWRKKKKQSRRKEWIITTLMSDVMIPRTHGTILSQHIVHGAILITVFKKEYCQGLGRLQSLPIWLCSGTIRAPRGLWHRMCSPDQAFSRGQTWTRVKVELLSASNNYPRNISHEFSIFWF